MLLDHLQRHAALLHLAVVLAVLGGERRREQVEIGLADQVRAGALQRGAIALIAERDVSLQILAENVLRQALDEGVIEGFRLAQGPLDGLALGDIAADENHALDGAAVAQRSAADAHPVAVRRLLVADEDLDVLDLLTADGPRQRQLGRGKGRHRIGEAQPVPERGRLARKAGGRDARAPGVRGSRQGGGAGTEESLGLGVDDQELPALVGDDDAVGHVDEDRLEQFGLFAERLLSVLALGDVAHDGEDGRLTVDDNG